MLSIITWLWKGPPTTPVPVFGPEDVNKLYRGLERHLRLPHTFWCITDHEAHEDFDPGIRAYPMFTDHAEMVAGQRACFRRLQLFDRRMADLFGPRLLQLDLDTVVVDDVTPLFDRKDPLMLHLQSDQPGRRTWNPSVLLMDAGVAHPLWERFHAAPKETWLEAKGKGWSCSDMSVINDYLHRLHGPAGGSAPVAWTPEDGVVSYWKDVRQHSWRLPPEARIVLFYGNFHPGDEKVQRQSPWIRDHWA